MSCTYDITHQEWQSLYINISASLYAEIYPQTIIWNTAQSLGVPNLYTTNTTNWCLLTCISACIFNNTIFSVNSSFNTDIPTVLTCLLSCYVNSQEEQPSSAEDPASSSSEVEQLQADLELQLTNYNESLLSTLIWYNDIIARAIAALQLVVASYAIWIGNRAAHEGVMVAALSIKSTGAAVEGLVAALKAVTAALSISVTETELGGAPSHSHIIIPDTSADALGEVYESITGMGSYIESTGDIVGTIGDIGFDTVHIAFDLASLGAQIVQHIIVITSTIEKIVQAIENNITARIELISLVTNKIQSKNVQIELRNQYNSLIDQTNLEITL